MYGQLQDGIFTPAPHHIVLDGRQIINPTDEMLAAAGYKEVVDTPQPEYDPATHELIPSYADGEYITKTWQAVARPPRVKSADERIEELESSLAYIGMMTEVL